jgi:uncharacterized protein YjbI with pentapeptide repeats
MKKIKSSLKRILQGLIIVMISGLIGILLGWEFSLENSDMPTFIITLIAFLAAAYAIWQQHIAGIKQDKNHQKLLGANQTQHTEQLSQQKILFEDQRKANITQEIIGAWQVLANKAAGNSGKIEAIQFLAEQGKSLQGIDMSKETHGEQVYLKNLNVSESELGKKADLCDANFEGANLWSAKFQGAYLTGANFKKSNLAGAGFEGVALEFVNFEGVELVRTNLRDAQFIESDLTGVDFKFSENFESINTFSHRNYITNNNNYDLPKVPEGFKIDFIDKNNPEIKIITNKDGTRSETKKYFIQLVQETQNS